MRSDYALYCIAIVCFVLAVFFFIQSYLVPPEMEVVIPMVLVILSLAFAGLGYMMRPGKAVSTTLAPQPPPPATPTPLPTVELPTQLTAVKGIGPKRAEQLKGLGIDTVENLAKASTKMLSAKTGVSQKIVRRWIREANKLVKGPS